MHFFNCDFLTYILYVLLILTWFFYKKTNLGLSFMAVGEHPRAAESAGIQVKKYRWIVMVFNGILGGIGGAYLVLVQLGVFTENMISGRGYIALATVILGRYTPFGMFGAALLFGAANALQIRRPDHRRIHFPVPSGNFAICADPYCNAWGCRKEQ